MRRVRFACRADRPFALPLGDTLGPWYAFRGLIGAAITAMSTDFASTLFKPAPVEGSRERPTTPWRLKLANLFAREVTDLFSFSVDLLGEEPCALAAEFAEAVRLAGSGTAFEDWRGGNLNRFGIDVRDEDGTFLDKVGYKVIAQDLGEPIRLCDLAKAAASRWRGATGAMLVLRTLTVLSERVEGLGKGQALRTTGDISAATMVGNVLRRLCVLDIATRRDPMGRSPEALSDAVEARDAAMAALVGRFPLVCADAVTHEVEREARQAPRLRGLIGSAVFSGERLGPWVPGFVACEVLGVGESTVYGAGQVVWLPIASKEEA